MRFTWIAALLLLTACRSLPGYGSPPPGQKRFSSAQAVELIGYPFADAMEPCISPDGQTLYINNSNAQNVQTHIYWCQRISPNRFAYKGIVPQTSSQSKDMAPTIDSSGETYFTSLREFDKTRRSLFHASLRSGGKRALPVSGEISPRQNEGATINMDCGISGDGRWLVISRARFQPPADVPFASDLLIADKQRDGSFALEQNSDSIMKLINTDALEYAPHLSADALRLYFTRCGKDNRGRVTSRILLASRPSTNMAFGAPVDLELTDGFIEAPSLTADESEIFFHKRIGQHYVIMYGRR